MNQEELNYQKSILDMANGAFQERVDYEIGRIIDNILDANTSATEKRKLTVTLEFKPDNDRKSIIVNVAVKSALAPTLPVRTSLYICGETSTGEMSVAEMVPQAPGQQNLFGGEQEPPATLKIVKLA